MVLVRAFNHRGFHRGLHVDAARSERMNQAMVHGSSASKVTLCL
jgi:hypothetical protein